MTKLIFVFLTLSTVAAFAETHSTAATVPNEPPAMQETTKGGSDAEGAVKMSKVMILEPKEGATVAKKFKVKFDKYIYNP